MKAGRILIPLDGSKTAEAAIPEAVAMARGRPCTFVLLCVAEAKILPGADVVGDWVEAVREAEAYLAAVKKRLVARPASGRAQRLRPSSRPRRGTTPT